jgi:hypothetical protein
MPAITGMARSYTEPWHVTRKPCAGQKQKSPHKAGFSAVRSDQPRAALITSMYGSAWR